MNVLLLRLLFIFFGLLLLNSCASLESINSADRIKAVQRCNNQATLLKVAQKDIDWKVRNVAFDKLNSSSLKAISTVAKDKAVVLAAKIRLGETSWSDAFSDSRATNEKLGDVIGAAALVNSPQPSSYVVVSACHNYIRKGDASRIPELSSLLFRFGDKSLAEDYMNCGNYELNSVGVEWGRAHGYNVRSGVGSHRVRWGEGK